MTRLSKGYKLVRRPNDTDEEFRRRHVMMVPCPAPWSMYSLKTEDAFFIWCAICTSSSAMCASHWMWNTTCQPSEPGFGRHRRSLWMSCHRWMSWRMRSSTIALWGEAFWLAVELHWLHLILMLDLNWFQIVVIPRCHLQCCAWTVLADLMRS